MTSTTSTASTDGGPVRVMVVVAHPDDETFGTGSILLHATAAGARTTVVCATRGEAGELAAGVDAPQGIAVLREAELRSAARRLGVDQVDLLDFEDSGMDGEPGAATLCGAPIEDVTDAVRGAIERHRPDLVVTLDGGDGHRDHQRIGQAVLEVLGGTATTVYLHTLPRSLMHAWLRHEMGNADVAAYAALPEIGTPDEEITTVLDTVSFLADRDAAIAEHRSQRSPFTGLPDDLRRAFLGTEHLIRVTPAWSGGPVEHELLGLR